MASSFNIVAEALLRWTVTSRAPLAPGVDLPGWVRGGACANMPATAALPTRPCNARRWLGPSWRPWATPAPAGVHDGMGATLCFTAGDRRYKSTLVRSFFIETVPFSGVRALNRFRLRRRRHPCPARMGGPKGVLMCRDGTQVVSGHGGTVPSLTFWKRGSVEGAKLGLEVPDLVAQARRVLEAQIRRRLPHLVLERGDQARDVRLWHVGQV